MQNINLQSLKVVALAGGVGGAKLAHGLAKVMPPEKLAIIVNTGDDFEHLGMKICPDLDTICYTLADLANYETGWGRADETWDAMESIVHLGGPDWFRLGDRDLGTHLERTRRINTGQPLSMVTRDFCAAWDIGPTILPMSDDPVPTQVFTDQGRLSFQEYFVHQKCQPEVRGFSFENFELAKPAPGIIVALKAADLIVICPSNPWVSIDPILALPKIKEGIKSCPVVAVSPIIGRKAIKGPAAKMYAELGVQPSALVVADHYRDILSGFVVDDIDLALEQTIQNIGMQTLVTSTIMNSMADRRHLARDVLDFGVRLVIKYNSTSKGQ